MTVLFWFHRPGEKWDAIQFVPLLTIMASFLVPMLFRNKRRGWVIGALALLIALCVFLVIRNVVRRPTASEAIKQVWFDPVGVSNNVVVVDVSTIVERWSAEVRAGLTGPHLTAEEEAALKENVAPGFVGTLVKPLPTSGNQSWRLLPAGRLTWRVGFVLPTAALAEQAFRSWQPFSPFTNAAGAGYATKLFTVRAADGAEYRAEIQVAPPLHSGNAVCVSMSGQSARSDTALRLNWQIQTAKPGYVRVTRPGAKSTAQLRLNPKSKLQEAEVSLELVRLGTNRVRLVRRAGDAAATAEFDARFADLAEELARTAQFSAKTVRGELIELCRFQGEPLVVQINDLAGSSSPGTSTLASWPSDGLAMLSPIVGPDIPTNSFCSATTILKRRHVGVWTLTLETPEGTNIEPKLSFWALDPNGPEPLSVRADWTARNRPDGRATLELFVDAYGRRFLDTTITFYSLTNYSWHAVPQTRSYWVGPGEWNLNDTNQIVMLEGVQRDDPSRRATARLSFSLFALPNGAGPVWTHDPSISSGVFKWREVLRVRNETVFPVTRLSLPTGAPVADPTRAAPPELAGPEAGAPRPTTPGEMSRRWLTMLIVLGIVVIGMGVGVVLLVMLLRKRGSGAVKILAVLAGLALLLFLLLAVASWLYLGASRARQARTEALRAEEISEQQAVVRGFPTHIEFKVLRVENPPGTRTLLVHFERDANPGLGLEAWQAVRGDQPPAFPIDVLRRTQWVGSRDTRTLSWTLPPPFTANDARRAAAQLEKDLFAQRDAYKKLFADSAPILGEVRHPDGWSFQLLLRVKREEVAL